MKPIRIGVVTPWSKEDWDGTRLVKAFRALGAEVGVLDPARFAARTEGDGVEVTVGGEPASAFDAFVLARGLGRSGDPDAQFEIYRALEGAGAIVVNRLEPLLAAQDKFRSSWLLARAGVPTPPAAVAQTAEEAEAALAALGEAVAKPLAGSLGDGVERVRLDAAGWSRVAQRIEQDGAVYLQAYVPHPGRDLRVFVVGGRARAAIARHAPRGEWRTNVSLGGRAEAAPVGARVAGTAEAAAAALALDYAGVDLVETGAAGAVIEVNGNPGWRGILEATGLDMAEAIAEHVLGRALRRRGNKNHVVREITGAIHG